MIDLIKVRNVQQIVQGQNQIVKEDKNYFQTLKTESEEKDDFEKAQEIRRRNIIKHEKI